MRRVWLAPAVLVSFAGGAALATLLHKEPVTDTTPATVFDLGAHRRFALPLNNPDVVPAKAASHMKPDDLVFGIVIGGRARAYPQWVLRQYHLSNDIVANTPFYLAHCEVCSGAAAFHVAVDVDMKAVDADTPSLALTFQLCGQGKVVMKDGTFRICDYQTGSAWHPFVGRSVEGYLSGTKLKRIPVVAQRWQEWVEHYPHTAVVYGSQALRERPHGASESGGFGHESRLGLAHEVDERLAKANALVFGIAGPNSDDGIAEAYRLCRRPHFLGGWGLWDVQVGFRRRCVSAPFGW